MPRLDALPAGSELFIDANIFLEHFLRRQLLCTAFLERVVSQEVIGVTSVGVVAEVRHGLLRAEASARYQLSSRNTLRYLREHPETIAHLTDSHRTLTELRGWPLRIVHATQRNLWQACRLSEQYGLLTNDALHLAVMLAHRWRHLASADRDFLRVPALTVWHP